MPVDVKIPELGESITEAEIVRWLKNSGDSVNEDEPIAEIETDKATAELPAPVSGVIEILAEEGATVKPGDVVARIAEGKATDEAPPKKAPAKKTAEAEQGSTKQAAERARSPFSVAKKETPPTPAAEDVEEKRAPTPPASTEPTEARPTPRALSPAVRRLVEERGLDPSAVHATGPGGRLTKGDVLDHAKEGDADSEGEQPGSAKGEEPGRLSLVRSSTSTATAERRTDAKPQEEEERVRMSRLRRSIAQRLVEAQQTAAILTTFNEIDMSRVMDTRKRFKEQFTEVHGVSLGFMSFFARACILALREIPAVNAEIEGEEIVYHKRVHLGIAASTDRGLIVPVVHNADTMGMADLEREIGRLAELARTGKIAPGDLAGGTFTISNGGVFGSLMSTPILNPPQSGILGMHKIEKRPVVVDDEIVVRPMMYVALSYDHRLIDGREAVTFLVRVKERIEDPERLLLEI